MKRITHRWPILLSCVAFLGLALASAAQEPENTVDDDFVFWSSRERGLPAAAAQVVGMADPFGAFALRAQGLQLVVWDEVGFSDLFAPELNPNLLKHIRDNRWLPNLVSRPVNEIPLEDLAFYKAYSEALGYAHEVPLEAFKRSAWENRHVTFAHLMSTPSKYRGRVIGIKGRMVMLRREDPAVAAKNRGVTDVYVGWVFGPTRHSHPFCIQFPSLPPGLEPAEAMNKDVEFFGYFLAKFKYEAKNGPEITPLLIGPTVIVEEKEAAVVETDTPMALIVLGIAMSFVAFLTVVFFLMYFWFKMSDRRVLATISQIKTKHSPFPLVDEPAPPPLGTRDNPAPSQLLSGLDSGVRLPEAKPIDPERN